MAIRGTQRLMLTSFGGLVILGGLLFSLYEPQNVLGRVLDGDELLRVQVESDFDRDGRITFTDFTIFAAFYEEEAFERLWVNGKKVGGF